MYSSHTTAHHWGAGLAQVDNGKLVRVDAHPLDPAPSRINENIAAGVQSRARVSRPSVRKSYLESGPGSNNHLRGEEPFIEVDYNTALDLLAAELQRVKREFGNSSIFAGSYGWASAGRFHHAQSQLKRFMNCFGGFVRSEGNYSYNAALTLMPYIIGNFRDHVRQATRWSTVAKEGQLVVMFGGVPLRNTQVSGGGIAKHRLLDDLRLCTDAGVNFVNISPLKTDAVDEINAEWIPIRPSSDTALMMALSHTLISEKLHNQEFIDRYTSGFEQTRAYLFGETDGIVKNAHWASSLCDIPEHRILQLAREMASSRTLICTAVSLQRQKFGEQPLWMTVTLAALLGQIGLPGRGFGIGYGADASIGTIDRPFRWPSFPQGSNQVEEYIPVASISDCLLNPGAAYEYNGKNLCYPDIRMVWWAGGNPFHHQQDLNKLRRAFHKPDTIVINEINWTSTARHADIVLPVTSAMERDDIGAGSQDNAIIPMPAAIKPVGEARDEYAIYCELEQKLGLKSSFSLGRSSGEWLHKMWDELTINAKEFGYELPVFDDFMAGDIISFHDPKPDAVFLQEFRADPEQHALATPDGKIALASETIGSFSYDDCPAHPQWLHKSEVSPEFTLQLLSGQPETRLHSQFDNGAFSRSKKIKDREPVLIHPADASSRNIVDGDVVRLFNANGSCLAAAVLSENIKVGAVFLWTGAWYDPDFSDPEHRDNHGNPNVLTDDKRSSRLSQGPAVDAFINLEKFSGELPPIRVFQAPIINSQ